MAGKVRFGRGVSMERPWPVGGIPGVGFATSVNAPLRGERGARMTIGERD
jgi:hypothetical protein